MSQSPHAVPTGGTHDVVVSRVLDAAPGLAWRAWSDPALLQQWWGPEGFTCPRAEVDLRPGGTTFLTMQAPAEWGGASIHTAWHHSAVLEPRRIEFVSTFVDASGARTTPAAAGIPGAVPAEVPHVVDLEPLPDGRTRVTVTESGYTDADTSEQSRAGQEECLDKMQRLFRGHDR